MNDDLLVILQSHSESNALEQKKKDIRYTGTLKIEVSKRCVLSLIHSLNYARIRNPKLNIKLFILDDHSDEIYLNQLKEIFSISNFTIELISLECFGIMNSIAECYNYGKKHSTGFVYFVQDDFLHTEKSIYLMIENYKKFSIFLNNELMLSGWHDTRGLMPDVIGMGCRVVPGVEGYWRTFPQSQFTMLTTSKFLNKNWDVFELMSQQEYNENCERNSFGWLPSRGYFSFCPINSLVLQVQWEVHKDPYINWKELWDFYDFDKFFGKDFLLTTDYYYLGVKNG